MKTTITKGALFAALRDGLVVSLPVSLRAVKSIRRRDSGTDYAHLRQLFSDQRWRHLPVLSIARSAFIVHIC